MFLPFIPALSRMTAKRSMENYMSQNLELFAFSPLITQRRVRFLLFSLLSMLMLGFYELLNVKCASLEKM